MPDSNKLIKNMQPFYGDAARSMPWRERTDPYSILLSEMMLQQTQVARVIPKFEQFIKQFPTIETLADAPQSSVLRAWSGLGYNRRARYLHQSAKMIVAAGGSVPDTVEALLKLPGVGANTAGAIIVYAFNKPAVFIETNIRSVFIHEFFKDGTEISDSQIVPLIAEMMNKDNPREWYWAVMDYGAWLKRSEGNNISRSAHYAKQSKFEGSQRQLRGRVLRALAEKPLSKDSLREALDDERLDAALESLLRDGLIFDDAGVISLVD